MEVLMVIIAAFFLLCIVGWIWRINLIVNHPEKEQRIREFGEYALKRQTEVAEKVVSGGKKAVGIGMKIASVLLKK